MKNFLLGLSHGLAEEEIPSEHKELVANLIRLKILKLRNKTYTIQNKYRAGKIDISFNGTGFVETFSPKQMKDLLIEPNDVNGALKDDLVIVKRLHTPSGRQKAKVVYIVQRAHFSSVVYTKEQKGRIVGLNIKSGLTHVIAASQKSLKQLPPATVLKIDNETNGILEVLGVLDDPKVDEKISMELFEKVEEFSKEAELEASSHGDFVDKSLYPNRVDLTHLPFCTIDPVDAKDFDDAIYFDEANCILYVAIADVSEYVFEMGPCDKEAKKRAFSIYFPHKSIPMLPRTLSENICSLKPNEDRLAFTFKITIDPETLKPKKEELLNTLIHSKRRFTYDEVDKIFEEKSLHVKAKEADFDFLFSLKALMDRVKKKRLEESFEFSSSEVRMSVDEEQNLLATRIEDQTPSHSLIEDCMLLANKAAAKRLDYGMFRVHEDPSFEKIEQLLEDLALVGIHVNFTPQLPKLIKQIQQRAQELDIREEVDKLIIRAQKKAKYAPENQGHFGLGFNSYTHFTSPIRRYSDLTLHRLLKADLQGDKKRKAFLLKDIETLCEQISSHERDSDKVAWDYMDRKYARWANEHMMEEFEAIVVDVKRTPVAKLDDEIMGARLFLMDEDVELFERVKISFVEVDIPSAKIYARVVKRIR